ncbi:MAG: hypothetical protein ACF8AM_02375, partial [Rhodopirellula sp. JB055]
GSLYHWSTKTVLGNQLLSAWPVRRSANWIARVQADFTKSEREQLAWSVRRGVPFGEETWVESIARKFDLESTMRPRGRPKKLK